MPSSERPPTMKSWHDAHAARVRARILLGEDDEEMRELLTLKLRADGHEVVAVSDGGRMLVRIASTYDHPQTHVPYDLIITDIRMPVCNGLAIVEGLRSARWSMPVIVMTAFGDAATRARAENLNALFFTKPFDVDDLRTAVSLLLSRAPHNSNGLRPSSLRWKEPPPTLDAEYDLEDDEDTKP